jgi:hypothetical protein
MATLPDERALGERPVPQGTNSVASYSVPGASNRGSIMAGAGNELQKAGQIIEQTNARYDTIAAEDAYNKLQATRQDLEASSRTVLGSNAIGKPFFDGYTEKFNGATQEISDGLANDQQRRMFKQRAQISALQYRGGLLQHQAIQTDINARNVYENTRSTELNNVIADYKNPDVINAANARINATIDAEADRTGQDSSWAESQKKASTDALTMARLQSWRLQDPVGALSQFQTDAGKINPAHAEVLGHQLFEAAKPVMATSILMGQLKTTAASDDEAKALMLQARNIGLSASVEVMDVKEKRGDSSNPVFDALPINQKMEVMHAAAVLKSQSDQLVKVDLGDRIRDAQASYLATGTFPSPPTKEELVATYGEDKGGRIAVDLAETQKLGKALQVVGGMSPEQKQQALINSTPIPGDGFASAQQRQEVYAQAIRQSNEAIAKDPSGYALKNSPMVQSSYSQLAKIQSSQNATQDQITEASTNYAKTSYAEQTRLGVADPKLLPNDMADQVVAGFNREISDGNNMATRIDAASKQWGNYWPDVYRQLATQFKGQLPDSFLTIPGLNSNSAKEEMARLDHVDIKDIEKTIVNSDVKTAKELIQQGLKPWAESMLTNQTNSNLYQAAMTGATKMALSRIQKGQSVGSAVEAATSSFIGDYEFPNTLSVNRYMVPKNENVAEVTNGVKRVISALPQLNIGAPPFGDQTGMRNKEELTNDWKQTVISNPLWVTNSQGTGLKLYAIGKDGRQYPVNTPQGQQIEYSWDGLRQMSRSSDDKKIDDPFDMRQVDRKQAEEKNRQRAADRAFEHANGVK